MSWRRGSGRGPGANDGFLTLLSRSCVRGPVPAAVFVVAITVTGCASTGAETATGAHATVRADERPVGPGPTGPSTGSTGPSSTQDEQRESTGSPGPDARTGVEPRLPGLGPGTFARIPADARQVVLVTGRGVNSSRSRVELYRRTAWGWQAGATWSAHNALKGWTDDHHTGDLRSPIGVFTLSDAGGRLPDPGSRLPYSRSGGFVVGGTGFEGEPLAGSFDYVIAIDYNHQRGTSPLDWTRPLGADKGGGIWLHVDHGGPTQACISLERAHMKALLRTLDPAQHPVIVMGDADSLRK
ncbi:hypothetical protein ACWDYK_10630 [Streptomyces anthocyanicus]|uniref:hypothetical protein n=1 Tax=Streptomyces anthocyanicus TaxID=68174 RepID=UPI002F91AE32